MSASLIGVNSTSTAAEPTPRPDPCHGAPRTAAAYQAAFAGIASSGSGWSTADGYVPVPLPDGRTAWLMSDTLLAPPAADPNGAATFVHNSIVVQRGRCFTPVMGGSAAQRDDLVPLVFGRACWPGAGVAHGTTLALLCTDVESVEGPPGFGFRIVGTSVATIRLPGLTFTRRAPLPFVEPAGIRWGTAAVRLGRWAYIYGSTTTAQYVARAPVSRLATRPWQFWTGRGWGARAALVPMTFTRSVPAMPAFVTPTTTGFIGLAFAWPLPSPHIAGWTAAAPQGPWRPVGTITTATTAPGQFAYDARAVDLGRAGWAVVYNVNDPVAVATEPGAYGGRFSSAPRRLGRLVDQRN